MKMFVNFYMFCTLVYLRIVCFSLSSIGKRFEFLKALYKFPVIIILIGGVCSLRPVVFGAVSLRLMAFGPVSLAGFLPIPGDQRRMFLQTCCSSGGSN